MDDPSVYYQKDLYYSVTINPNDSHQYFGNPNRFDKFRHDMYEMLIGASPQGINYHFVIELSEPRQLKPGTDGPRYHLHGWIQFKHNEGIFNFLDHVMYHWSRYAYVDIDTIADMKKWELYMTKQSSVFGKRNILLSNITENLFTANGETDSSESVLSVPATSEARERDKNLNEVNSAKPERKRTQSTRWKQNNLKK